MSLLASLLSLPYGLFVPSLHTLLSSPRSAADTLFVEHESAFVIILLLASSCLRAHALFVSICRSIRSEPSSQKYVLVVSLYVMSGVRQRYVARTCCVPVNTTFVLLRPVLSADEKSGVRMRCLKAYVLHVKRAKDGLHFRRS